MARSPAPAAPAAGAATDVDVAELAARLRLSATRLARRLRQESGTGHTPSQLSALAAVDHLGPLTLGALADHERVAPPSITKVIGKLEAEGLVERSTDAGDRRVTHVRTTAAGRALLEETRRRKTSWLAGQLGALDPAERTRLAAAVDVLESLTRSQDTGP